MAEDAIKRIKADPKDYYKVLDIEKSADESVIKKSYRKLALLLHPDKCSLEGAEEAFKSVSAAYKCLSNEEQRKLYNLTGSESSNSSGGSPFEGVNPEEIFAQFFSQQGGMPGGFGGGFPGGNVRFYSLRPGGFGARGFPGGAGEGGFPGAGFASGFPGGFPGMGGGGGGGGGPVDLLEALGLPPSLRPALTTLSTAFRLVPTPVLLIGGVYLAMVSLSFVLARLPYFIVCFLVKKPYKWYLLSGIVLLGVMGVI